MAVTTVSCDRCLYRSRVVSEPRQYILANGLTLPVYTNFAWCQACDSVTEVEDLPDRNDIQQHLDWLIENKTAALAKLKSKTYEDELNFYRRLIHWRDHRTSPPRCLSCGKPGFIQFETVKDPHSRGVIIQANHPNCGGKLVFNTQPKRILEHYFFYDSEGSPTRPQEDDLNYSQR